MSEFLSPAEVRELTGCVSRESQRTKLGVLGVPFRADGARILVSRIHVRAWLTGEELRQSQGPRLDLVR